MPRKRAHSGHPDCEACQGSGGWQGPRGWVKCACVRPSTAYKDAIRLMNTPVGGEWKDTLFDLPKEHDE